MERDCRICWRDWEEGEGVRCEGFHAYLSPSMCARNKAMALRAANLLHAGMGLKGVGGLDLDRMMVCGRCGRVKGELREAGIEMGEVFTKVRDEIVGDWEREEKRQESVRGDMEGARRKEKERGRKWREEHREEERVRLREWRRKKRQEKEMGG